MAIPVTPKPPFPNVPNLPGVPSIPRQSGLVSAQQTIVLVASDAITALSLFQQPQWGLFTQSGAPAFSAVPGLGALSALVNNLAQATNVSSQSVVELEYRSDHRISTAPLEQGSFLSYNKVAMPFNGRVSYAVGGSVAARSAFLAQARAYEASLDLLSLVMPEYSYDSVNVVHSDFRREARRGVTMFVVDIWVEEVRITGTAQFSATAAPSSASQVNGGTVQAQTPPPGTGSFGPITSDAAQP
jgi:hypothetical protein